MKSGRLILGLQSNHVPKPFIYWNLGWESLTLRSASARFKFLARLQEMSSERLTKKVFLWSQMAASQGVRNWYFCTQELASKLDLSLSSFSIDQALTALRAREQREWQSQINELSSLSFFSGVGGVMGYLQAMSGPEAAPILRLLSGRHGLELDTGRRFLVTRSSRLCRMCNKIETEDENHFLFRCPLYVVPRLLFLAKVALVSQLNLVGFDCSSSQHCSYFVSHVLNSLPCLKLFSRYLTTCFKLRESHEG